MILASGIGSHPGEDQASYDEAVRVVLGELAAPGGLPYLPEVPGRGPGAGMSGRALAVVAELAADLQPAGWRLTGTAGTSGVDHRRARSLLAQDLDAVEEHAQGYAGAFKLQVGGPWTLAATVERPRGDKVLADIGARRDLAQALAEGLRDHVADLRRRLPGVERLVVQVDEPALPAVLAGAVPTASGFHRHRTVELPEAMEALEWVLDSVAGSGAEGWVHSCAAGVPWDALGAVGSCAGLSVDLAVLTAADHDRLGGVLDRGDTLALGVVPAREPVSDPADPTAGHVTESVLRWLEMLGLDPDLIGDRLVLTPTCGFAGAAPAWPVRALGVLREAAANLSR